MPWPVFSNLLCAFVSQSSAFLLNQYNYAIYMLSNLSILFLLCNIVLFCFLKSFLQCSLWGTLDCFLAKWYPGQGKSSWALMTCDESACHLQLCILPRSLFGGGVSPWERERNCHSIIPQKSYSWESIYLWDTSRPKMSHGNDCPFGTNVTCFYWKTYFLLILERVILDTLYDSKELWLWCTNNACFITFI